MIDEKDDWVAVVKVMRRTSECSKTLLYLCDDPVHKASYNEVLDVDSVN
jgi:hypothetical protein